MVAVNYDWDELEDNIDEEYDDAGIAVAEYTTEPGQFGNVVSLGAGPQLGHDLRDCIRDLAIVGPRTPADDVSQARCDVLADVDAHDRLRGDDVQVLAHLASFDGGAGREDHASSFPGGRRLRGCTR